MLIQHLKSILNLREKVDISVDFDRLDFFYNLNLVTKITLILSFESYFG